MKKTKGSCQYFLGRNFDGDGTGILLQHPLRVRSVDEDWSAVHHSSLNQISLEKTYYQPTSNGVSNPSITIDVARTSPEQTITRGQGCPPPKQSSTISTVTQTGTQAKSQEHNQAGGADSMTGSTESKTQGFFGSSSASSFMQQVKTAIDARVLLSNQSYPHIDPSWEEQASMPSTNAPSSTLALEYDLPHRRMADKFLAVYWEIAHSLYPFLDRVKFEKAYSSLWTGEVYEGDERVLICILNIIFALSCQLSDSIKMSERSAAAELYFQRSKHLLNVQLWDAGSIETIQCLLLMGQYLQSTSNAHQCWMAIGHAVRVAQGLGLHLSESAAIGNQSCRERENIRRIWHGCVFMDR